VLNLFSLEGKTAIVTGGGTGIGQAIAIGLAQAGANVGILVNTDQNTQTRDAVEGAGRKFAEVILDLTDKSKLAPSVAAIEAQLGPVDVLVNNAGIIRREDANKFSESDWESVIEINLNVVWRMSQLVGSKMLERGGGKIINIASLLAFQGGIRVPSYTAAKHGVAGITKALANEWAGRGVNINAIAPGYIATDNTAQLRADADRSQSILDRIPAGRWGTPQDLAGTAVFLASSAADYINGHVLVVDGGWMAR
jgi:2-dehydro-3-deoxy-D-gluconate 5-dehydrogenase